LHAYVIGAEHAAAASRPGSPRRAWHPSAPERRCCRLGPARRRWADHRQQTDVGGGAQLEGEGEFVQPLVAVGVLRVQEEHVQRVNPVYRRRNEVDPTGIHQHRPEGERDDSTSTSATIAIRTSSPPVVVVTANVTAGGWTGQGNRCAARLPIPSRGAVKLGLGRGPKRPAGEPRNGPLK
jgi:hypothetical protein